MTYDRVVREAIQNVDSATAYSASVPVDNSMEATTSAKETKQKTSATVTTMTNGTRHHRIPSKPSNRCPTLSDNKTKQQRPMTTANTSPVIKNHKTEMELETPRLQVFITHLCFTILQIFGIMREFLRKYGFEKKTGSCDNNPVDFPPLFVSYESFYIRNCYMRSRDIFNRPICSVPGAEIEIMERKTNDYNWTYYFTGNKTKALNMGSYNYLGFAENDGPSSRSAMRSVEDYGVATSGTRQELGELKCQQELELLMAKFLGVDAVVTFGMGFATNSMNIPTLICQGKKTLIISDELNHASLILGARLSGATVKVFKHNSVLDLEEKLKRSIVEGHPASGRPWEKIIIIVEGIYR